MSVSMFTNALRAQSRLRVLTAARVALPVTRSISSLVAFRTAVPKNVSPSVSRLFTTSRVAPYDNSPKAPPGPTIFVAKIPWNTTEQDLTQVFSEFGEVTAVRLHINSDGRPRGIAHIDFANAESAVATVDSAMQEPIHLAGRDLRIDFAVGLRDRDSALEPNEKLYFSGFAGDEMQLRNIFNKFADSLVDIHLLKNPVTGERNPTGFLQFESKQVATEALEALNGVQTPDGETLNLSYARPRRTQSAFGNSGRDGGRDVRDGRGARDGGRGTPRWNNGR